MNEVHSMEHVLSALIAKRERELANYRAMPLPLAASVVSAILFDLYLIQEGKMPEEELEG